MSRSRPGGSERYSTGSPLLRHCTPWKTLGRNPLPQQPCPPLGCTPLEISTTKPGRFCDLAAEAVAGPRADSSAGPAAAKPV